MTDCRLTRHYGSANMAILIATLLAAAAVWLFQWWYVPGSDDLMYTDFWHPGSDRPYYKYAVWHWLSVNGRLANLLAPLLLALPRWAGSTVVAVCYALLLILTMRQAAPPNEGGFGARALIFFLIVITLPWADALMLYDCHMNYTLATVLTLWWLLLLKNWAKLWLLIVVGLAAGAMHEGCSLAICAGLLVWLTTGNHWKDKPLVKGAVAYGLGTMFCILSPGILYRIGSAGQFTRWWIVLLTSDYYVVLLGIIVVNILIFKVLRYKLWQLARTDWIIYAVAAAVSAAISSFSGIVGRSGFFAQIFALIALVRLCVAFEWKVNRSLAAAGGAILLAASVAQLCYAAYWQRIVGGEANDVIRQYSKTGASVAYADIHTQQEMPVLTLGKTRGAPEPHDIWIRTTIRDHYGLPELPVVLPTELRGVNLSSLHTPLKFGQTIISPYEPPTHPMHLFENVDIATFTGYVYASDEAARVSPVTLNADRRGRRYSVTPVSIPGRTLYLLAPYGYDVFQDLR